MNRNTSKNIILDEEDFFADFFNSPIAAPEAALEDPSGALDLFSIFRQLEEDFDVDIDTPEKFSNLQNPPINDYLIDEDDDDDDLLTFKTPTKPAKPLVQSRIIQSSNGVLRASKQDSAQIWDNHPQNQHQHPLHPPTPFPMHQSTSASPSTLKNFSQISVSGRSVRLRQLMVGMKGVVCTRLYHSSSANNTHKRTP